MFSFCLGNSGKHQKTQHENEAQNTLQQLNLMEENSFI